MNNLKNTWSENTQTYLQVGEYGWASIVQTQVLFKMKDERDRRLEGRDKELLSNVQWNTHQMMMITDINVWLLNRLKKRIENHLQTLTDAIHNC